MQIIGRPSLEITAHHVTASKKHPESETSRTSSGSCLHGATRKARPKTTMRPSSRWGPRRPSIKGSSRSTSLSHLSSVWTSTPSSKHLFQPSKGHFSMNGTGASQGRASLTQSEHCGPKHISRAVTYGGMAIPTRRQSSSRRCLLLKSTPHI